MIDNRSSIDILKQKDFFKSILDVMRIGVVVSDSNGYVIYCNNTYAQFLNTDLDQIIGKYATDVVDNSRLHIVAQTGQTEINYPHKHKGVGYLVHRIPIKQQGKTIAVLGLILFDNATTAVKLSEKCAHLESKLKNFQEELGAIHRTIYDFDCIIGKSKAMKMAKNEALQASTNDLPVFITGESGTGKELFAQSIHQASARKTFPFVQVNCAAIPKDLLESELFGYVKGSFTGASRKGKPGKFELANMGTIFLDEIGDMPLEMQPKILRILEMKQVERIGSHTLTPSDFRVIAATNQDMESLMKSGLFRRDLYFRLNVVPIHIKPLRERIDDILLMAYSFIQKIIKGPAGKGIRILTDAEKALLNYKWPGNGRELLHAMERVLVSTKTQSIDISDLPEYFHYSETIPIRDKGARLNEYLHKAEQYAIKQALVEADNNKTLAADILGIHRTILYRKMKKLNIALS
ncbi:MAG: sigma 54-interacting transcriptional regulator [Desulfobacterales bacterium]|nr:sigma 54-interacting transcriptional regulator [Desulfobacterales bacterium]MBU8910746.1 sigma 54-interacting transcriptional regulator [Desulfobacterales bacterium]